MILTDHAYTILSLLRMRTDADTDVRFASRETFSMETVKREQPMATEEMYVKQWEGLHVHSHNHSRHTLLHVYSSLIITINY